MARHNIDIAIRARDEASATINQMGGLFKSGLGLWAVERAAAGAARAYQLFTLSVARSEKAMAGDAQGALEKHLELNEAWKDTLRLIPGARPLVDAFFDAFGREEEIKKTIETIKALTAVTGQAKKKADEWGNAAEIAAAKMRKAPESEIAAIRARQEAEGRGKDISELQKELDKGQKEYAVQKERLDVMLSNVRASSPIQLGGMIWRGETAGGLEEQIATVKKLKTQVEETAAEIKRLTASADVLQQEGQAEARQKRVEEGGLWIDGNWIPRKEVREADRAAAEEATKRAEEARRSAEAAKRLEEEKIGMIQAAQDRAYNATHEARERELHDIDRRYLAEQAKWHDHADVMAALQDAYHEERAAALKKFADEGAEVQFRAAEKAKADSERARSEAERQARAEFGGAWRAPPTLVSGYLMGVGAEQQAISEARRSGNVLERIEELLKKADRRDSASTTAGAALTVKIEDG